MTRTSARALAVARPVIRGLILLNAIYALLIGALLVFSFFIEGWPQRPLGFDLVHAHPMAGFGLRMIVVVARDDDDFDVRVGDELGRVLVALDGGKIGGNLVEPRAVPIAERREPAARLRRKRARMQRSDAEPDHADTDLALSHLPALLLCPHGHKRPGRRAILRATAAPAGRR